MSYDNRVELDTAEYYSNLRDGTQSDVYKEHIGEYCLDIVECLDNYDTELTETELKYIVKKVQEIRETILSHTKVE